MSLILLVENLSIGYDTKKGVLKAVDNISLSIGHRETIGLIGPNGSGKSTLLKMIATIWQSFAISQ